MEASEEGRSNTAEVAQLLQEEQDQTNSTNVGKFSETIFAVKPKSNAPLPASGVQSVPPSLRNRSGGAPPQGKDSQQRDSREPDVPEHIDDEADDNDDGEIAVEAVETTVWDQANAEYDTVSDSGEPDVPERIDDDGMIAVETTEYGQLMADTDTLSDSGGLADENRRLLTLNIHTRLMKENDKMGDDVDLPELASLTKNFSDAEIKGLVHCAQSTALNRLIKVTGHKVEVDPEAVARLLVTRQDFLYSLANDIKPAFGSRKEEFEKLIANGIISVGSPVQHVLENGDLLISQAKCSDRTPMVTVCLEGPAGSGKTALAAQIAKNSDFPFVRVCSPENMMDFHEAAKCQAITKIFDDAYKSPLSCIIVDDIERLLDYVPIGPRFSNLVLRALLVLLKKVPPHGHKLLIIATSTRKDVLQEMGLLSVFNNCIHVSNISTSEHLMAVIENLDVFTSEEMEMLARRTSGKTLWICIKKLMAWIEMVRQIEGTKKINKLLCLLEEKASLQM